MEQQQPTPKPPEKGGVGPVLGIIVIIIVLALGGLYYFTKGVDQIPSPSADQAALTPEDEAAMIEAQGTSANLSDIQADVNATDVSGLDNSAAAIDSTLQTQ